MRRRTLGLAAALLTLTTFSVAGSAAVSGASDSRVGFEVAGPAGLKINGTTTELSATEDSGNVVISVPLGNLTTGISLRDQHMRDKYLEVAKYPAATLILARSALKVPSAGEADVPGTLKLHGQSRPVTVHYDTKSDGAAVSTHGRFHINMNDFGITVPSYLGVTVKPEVDVTASFKLAGT
jgi:polyisoprenoid-binding protein YceI